MWQTKLGQKKYEYIFESFEAEVLFKKPKHYYNIRMNSF